MKIDINRLLLAMARAKLTDTELSQNAGIPKSTFANVKAGRRNPKPVMVGKLAEALQVDVEELVVL